MSLLRAFLDTIYSESRSDSLRFLASCGHLDCRTASTSGQRPKKTSASRHLLLKHLTNYRRRSAYCWGDGAVWSTLFRISLLLPAVWGGDAEPWVQRWQGDFPVPDCFITQFSPQISLRNSVSDISTDCWVWHWKAPDMGHLCVSPVFHPLKCPWSP